MKNTISIIVATIAMVSAMPLAAQRPSVNILGANDTRVDQLYGQVEHVSERTVAVDYSRRAIEPGQFIGAHERTYSLEGNVVKDATFDESGLALTKTIYQYEGENKTVSTTYDANGKRTLQTLYAFTADGLCAQMRFTDAIGVTISTSEVSHTTQWACEEETFVDGESVKHEYYYNTEGRLVKTSLTSSSDEAIVTTYTLDEKGYPRRATVKRNDTKQMVQYTYKYDEEGNWTRRVTTVDGKPTEITTRDILYF